ncbi:MAG TPA: hypothetical protein VJV75_01990 [Candidatus Polarisedimenticolia bacterium]|nr:hypothetical protein [Candidatus Polarisedimenticolia bacterium]
MKDDATVPGVITAAAWSVVFFGYYLVMLGLGLVFVPNLMLRCFLQPPTNEPWLRVLGIVATVLGCYYVAAGWGTAMVFIRATIWGRAVGAASFSLLVVLGIAPKFILVMAAVDAAGAFYTWYLLRLERR